METVANLTQQLSQLTSKFDSLQSRLESVEKMMSTKSEAPVQEDKAQAIQSEEFWLIPHRNSSSN